MPDIQLSGFESDASGAMSFSAMDTEGDRRLNFKLPLGYHQDNDLLAIAISTLLGTKYSNLTLDLAISDEARTKLSDLISAPVQAKRSGTYMSPPISSGTTLNFSGGFDSLAAKVLLPEDAKLVALDFGGAFERERTFFDTFNPSVISTDFRAKGFARNSWSFMGIGSILLRDYLGVDTYSFGSILEAAPFNLSPNLRFKGAADPWMAAAGMRKLNPVLGLTEVGTAMLLNEYVPDLVRESLVSLAAPKSEKFTRKVVLQALAEHAVGSRRRGYLFDVDQPSPHQCFGDSFATDFLALYILKKAGREVVGWLVSDIPSEIISAVQSMDLNFYERLNTNFYGSMEIPDVQRIYHRCLQAGILPYDQNDWREFAAVTKMISQYHPIPGVK
ncbi:hypothetical protein ACFVRT_10330 [Arthrobacter koreensis]|uniref:hypothetical protein n=1 Tax=Arthrobacter koreensis TaxID=199136 RepID=UPI0036DA7957